MTESTIRPANHSDQVTELDAVVVGAGFAGLYMLHALRQLGLTTAGVEAGADVGGTWYWNRYPGARCDVESLAYCYTFSDELVRDWQWSERYAAQPEILEYIGFAADRLDVRPLIRFSTRVLSARYDEQAARWHVTLDNGEILVARFCIMATGCLSEGRIPDIAGVEEFQGRKFHTGSWPHEPVDFSGQRVGIIGTGSSGIQAIPMIAEQAMETFVFQRTPSFTVPARNGPLDPAFADHFRAHQAEFVRDMRAGLIFAGGDLELSAEARLPIAASAMDVDESQREAVYEDHWQKGGARYMVAFPDQMVSAQSNAEASNFVRRKIRETIVDEELAERLTPFGYPLGSKRICLDTNYYTTFNRDDVTLVDVRASPIVQITQDGLLTTDATYRLDAIVFATGFDAMTGALNRIDIRGRDGRALAEEWHGGPATYLGIAVAGFPNLFLITGPGSPSVISNVVLSIEQHVEWLARTIGHMKDHGLTRIEADAQAQHDWVAHVNEVADSTLFPVANSWYVGANVPGKPRVFMPYVGGIVRYREICDEVAGSGWRGFTLT